MIKDQLQKCKIDEEIRDSPDVYCFNEEESIKMP